MSRVDEAMRRAAELGNGVAVAGSESQADDITDVRDLAREAFPIELPDRRPLRAAASPAPAAAPAAQPVERRSVTAPESRANGSVFQRIDATLAEKVVVDASMLPACREQYRRLAAALHHAQAANGLKVMMIASAVPGEGKTLTASNLALTLSESYQRSVLLIDGDLRRPTLHTLFRVENSAGLTDGLAAAAETPMAVIQVSRGLAVLPAGPASSDPMAGLTSDRMRALIDEARQVFDWVIVDTPPVAMLTDANLLAAMVDGAVLVVKAGSTPYELVKRAVDAIGRERILGTVLNQADAASQHAAYELAYYGYVTRTGSPSAL